MSTDYIMVGDSWVNTSGSPVTDTNPLLASSPQIIPAGATATWAGDVWIISDSPTASGTQAPASPIEGQRWIDTSTTPAVVKIYHQYLNPQWVSTATVVTQGSDIGVDNGATRNENRGLWSISTAYVKGDIVTTSNGDGWTCILANTGQSPPASSATVSNTYWRLLAARGENGTSPVQLYTFIMYSANSAPTSAFDWSTTPNTYIGIAANQVSIPAWNSSAWTWSKFKGDNGSPLYTWIVYSQYANGYNGGTASISSSSDIYSTYIGVLANSTSVTAPSTPNSYVWSKFKGADSTVSGDSAVRIYTVVDVSVADILKPTDGPSAIPTTPSGITWASTPQLVSINQKQYQCDGIKRTSDSYITWGNPYLSLFKVGTLQAINTLTGSLTSASATGERLTINESIEGNNTHEFRTYAGSHAPSKVIFSGGDRSVSSVLDTVVYADCSSTASANGANAYMILGKAYQCYLLRRADYPTSYRYNFSRQTMFSGIGAYLNSGSANTTNDISISIGTSGWLGNSEYARILESSYHTANENCEIWMGITDMYSASFIRNNNNTGFSTSVQIGNNSYAIQVTAGDIKGSGNISVAGNITAYDGSDKRIKEDIKPIENALSKIKKISGNTFRWIKSYYDKQDKELFKEYDVGVIAQEVQSVLPEAVHERSDGVLAVNYSKIIPLLIEAIKEQQSQIEELRNAITKLP